MNNFDDRQQNKNDVGACELTALQLLHLKIQELSMTDEPVELTTIEKALRIKHELVLDQLAALADLELIEFEDAKKQKFLITEAGKLSNIP